MKEILMDEVFQRVDESFEETRLDIIKQQMHWGDYEKTFGTPLNEEEKAYFKVLDLVVCNSLDDFKEKFKKNLGRLLLSK